MVQQMRLALGHAFQHFKKLRKGNSRGLCAVNAALSFSSQGSYRESHGDSMVSSGVNLGATESLLPRNAQTVFSLFALGAHAAKVLCHQTDPVCFLYPEFFPTLNLYPTP